MKPLAEEKLVFQPIAETTDWEVYRKVSLQPHGFGEERIRIWPKLLNVDLGAHASGDKRDARDDFDGSFALTSYYEEELSGTPHSDERQITLDTDRSFVLYPVEGLDHREKLQASLNRLIVSIFRKRPLLHYFQGYHDIVSVVFLTLPRELHLPVTEQISLQRVRDSMGPSLDPVIGLLRVMKHLLTLVDPHFAESLERTAPLPYYALSNLLTLFSHDVPTLPLIQHIFDYLLCRPPIATVYLAAALTLTRGEEVRMLEEEGEEGMMHSLLTVFPDLYEEGDDLLKPTQKDILDLSASQHEHGKGVELQVDDNRDDDPAFSAPLHDPQASAGDSVSAHVGCEAVVDAQGTSPKEEVPASSTYSSMTLDTSEKFEQSKPEPLPLDSSASDSTEPSSLPPTEHEKLAIPEDEEKPALPPTPARTSSLEPSPRPNRPRISLTALLTHADELMQEYPPTHPQIALSTIMGPQSVVHTWSESALSLPSDDDAERMVLHPDLIVNPLRPETDPSDDEREREHERKRRERRRKLRKPMRLTDVVAQKKTMVAGVVLALAVAMAVYGAKYGGGSHKGTLGWDWRKVGRLLGGFMAGSGERVFERIMHAI